MFFALSKLLDVFLSPFTWGLGLLALAVPWRGLPSSRRAFAKPLFGLAGLGILLTFSTETVSNRITYALEHAVSSTVGHGVTYDAVILLGGVSDERVTAQSGAPALNDSVERLIATHRLLADGRARTAIVSGAPELEQFVDASEARVLAAQLRAWGIDERRVILEEKARNTYENAVYSKRVVEERGFRRVLIVTSAFHMRRAVECFEAVGLSVDTLAVDFRAHDPNGPGGSSWLPRALYLADSTRMIREFFGLYIYRLRGYAKPLAQRAHPT